MRYHDFQLSSYSVSDFGATITLCLIYDYPSVENGEWARLYVRPPLRRSMKRHWIEYRDAWIEEPMTFWVHVPTDGKSWGGAATFNPPAPKPVPGRGWPVFFVEINDFVFRFASLDELDVCAATLSQKVLPTTRRLSAERGTTAGPNSHWLSRLPKHTKSWRYREQAVRYLLKAKTDFIREMQVG